MSSRDVCGSSVPATAGTARSRFTRTQTFTPLSFRRSGRRGTFAPGRHGWIQVVRGDVKLNGTDLSEGDGASLSDIADVEIEGVADAEILLFDLA